MKQINLLLLTCVIILSLHFVDTAKAALDNPLTTIELETPVHFLAPDGSDLRVDAGTYAIEPAEEWIRLMSGARHDAVLVEATKGTHEMELEHTMGLSVPGETEQEKDLHHVMLLLPGGQSLEATGTYSGIRHRGFLKKTFNKVKKRANRAYKKARSTAKKTVSKAKSTVKKATKGARAQVRKGTQTARNAALKAKRHVEKTARRVTSNIKSGIQKAKQSTSNNLGQWGILSQVASTAAHKEAHDWLRQAYVDSSRCKVMGPSAIGTPGVLKSRYRFKGRIQQALKASGASKDIAQGWDRAFKEAWEQWAKKTTIPGLPFYPAFSALPMASAPPMPNVPFPLSALVSAGAPAMTPPGISQKVLSKLGNLAKHQKVKNAVNAFATDIGGRFAACMAGCRLMTVMGSGPIPSFKPPFSPVGTVVNGTCKGGVIPAAVGFSKP